MAGHSKWANIKRKKGVVDAARGKLFTKLVKEITTAARLGGADPDGNPRLRAAIVAAKSNSMPAGNIERAIKKGSGTMDGPAPEEVAYEGYGASGVAIYVEAQTDNRNRTSAEIRFAFSKNQGNLGQLGSVGWMFKKRAQFVFDAARYTEDELFEAALDAGAEEVKTEDDRVVIWGEISDFSNLLEHFEKAHFDMISAEFTMIPENLVAVSGDDAQAVLKLIEKLEDLDDVQQVHSNFDISDDEMSKLLEDS